MRALGLRQIESSTKTERRAATKGEVEKGLRTGKPSTRQQFQPLCEEAAQTAAPTQVTQTIWKQRAGQRGWPAGSTLFQLFGKYLLT